MKKRILFFAVALVCLGTAAFAGGGAQKQSGGLPTVQWWLISDPPPNLAEAQKAINDYIGPKIGVNVEIKLFSWADNNQRQTTMLNSGEYWDIWTALGENYYDWARRGFLADITDSLPKYPGLTQAIPQNLWDGFKLKNRVYAVPTYKDSSATHYVIWDEALVRKYNIDLSSMKTMADYDKALRAIKAGEGARFYPIHDAKSDTTRVFLFMLDYDSSFGMNNFGVKFSDPNGKVINYLEDPEWISYLRYFRRWYQDGIINPDANVIDSTPTGGALRYGQGWPLAWDDNYATSQGWQRTVFNVIWGPVYTTNSILAYNTISANSRYKEESLKFLELVNTDRKLRDMLAYGVEGKDFAYVTPTTYRKLSSTWNLPIFEQGTFFIISTLDGASSPWDEVKQLNEQARVSSIYGFVFDRTSVQNEWANCEPVWNRYKVDLFTGAGDPDTLIPQCLTELKANGYDKILAEAQRQLDEWRKTK
ncbi:MAG: ABC transporter substrate-binding protein [Treponema sp.]|jgi:putative aldouronate transport system substrate-binding protein|nr:ABC transporter substrate-binding protein [Treponema sp.]